MSYVLTFSTVPGIVSVKMNEEGRHYKEEDVGHGVDELSNVGGEGVVVLAPVDGTGPSGNVTPHPKAMLTYRFTICMFTTCMFPCNCSYFPLFLRYLSILCKTCIKIMLKVQQ